MPATVTFDFAPLDKYITKAANKAFKTTLLQLKRHIEVEYIKSKRWDWPRITRRKTGAKVGSPRDIVDTAELLKSMGIEVDPVSSLDSELTGYIFNSAPHALGVELGYITNLGNIVPPRPFMSEGIKTFNFLENFQGNLEKELYG